jgi:hypothetical protein
MPREEFAAPGRHADMTGLAALLRVPSSRALVLSHHVCAPCWLAGEASRGVGHLEPLVAICSHIGMNAQSDVRSWGTLNRPWSELYHTASCDASGDVRPACRSGLQGLCPGRTERRGCFFPSTGLEILWGETLAPRHAFSPVAWLSVTSQRLLQEIWPKRTSQGGAAAVGPSTKYLAIPLSAVGCR